MPRVRLEEFEYTTESIIDLAKTIASTNYNGSMHAVLSAMCDNPSLSPSLSVNADGGIEVYLNKWVVKFLRGYGNKASQRQSNPTNTIHDDILDDIISSRLPNLAEEPREYIKYGHRLSMSAENIAGSLLEEYLADSIMKFGWHCCWGETMKSIDFCHEDGTLLQIKNSDNSENSSSKAVRDGTEIKHWFRRISRTGRTNWESLNNQLGINPDADKLSEDKFKAFVQNVITDNPGALYVEDEAPWE